MASNGRLPLSSLVKVDGWAYLSANTATAWNAACAEMVALGYARPAITAPDGAYRDIEGQKYWKKYWTDRGLPGNASTPGWSPHGWGTAVDIWDVAKFPRSVLREVFGRWGFKFTVASEAWHAQHDGLPRAVVANADAVAIKEEPERETPMKIISGGTIALVGEYEATVYTSASGGQGFSIEANGKAYGTEAGFTGNQVETLVNEARARRASLVADIAKRVIAALPALSGSPSIDYAALAKAVNDDAARRLKE